MDDDEEEEDGDAEGYEVVIGETEDVGDLEGEDFGSEEEEEEEERLFCDVCRYGVIGFGICGQCISSNYIPF